MTHGRPSVLADNITEVINQKFLRQSMEERVIKSREEDLSVVYGQTMHNTKKRFDNQFKN